jgi:hypothetical protein
MSPVTDRVEPAAVRRMRRRTLARSPTGRQALRAVTATTAGRVGLLCALIVTGVILVGSLRHDDATTVDIGSHFLGPRWAHPFGTDDYGRDELARVAAGVLRLLADAAARGIAILIASHDRTALQVLCHRVAEFHDGQLRERHGDRHPSSLSQPAPSPASSDRADPLAAGTPAAALHLPDAAPA